jgi:hypothetical protein
MPHEYKFLKPSEKNAIAYMLDHVEAITKRVNDNFAQVDPHATSSYQIVAATIYWRALSTFNCFKKLWLGEFVEDSNLLLRTLLEADVRLAFVGQDPAVRAPLYIKAADGDAIRMAAVLREARELTDAATTATTPEAGEVIDRFEVTLSPKDDEVGRAMRFWRNLSFRDLCKATNRPHDYIMYSMCSQSIHCAPISTLTPTMTEQTPFDSFAKWILLKTSAGCFLSIVASLSSAFAFPEISDYIVEMRRWMHTCDEEWSRSSIEALFVVLKRAAQRTLIG